MIYDMLHYARIVVEFVRGKTEADYQSDERLRFSVERAIELVGEPSRHLSAALKSAHPEIPWLIVAKQRHVLAHDYGEIDHAKIQRVATVHIPIMIPQLEAIRAEFPPDPTDPDQASSTR